MYSYGEATTDCAIVDGRLCHIDEFEDIYSAERPVHDCQECHTPLIYTYGTEKVYHFRHQPGIECLGGVGMEPNFCWNDTSRLIFRNAKCR